MGPPASTTCPPPDPSDPPPPGPRRARWPPSSSPAAAPPSPATPRTTSTSTSTSTSAVVATDATTVEDALADDVAVETGDTSYDEADATAITLSGTGATSDSDAVTVADGTVTITAAGTYVLSGDLTGQVVVDSAGDGVVRLVLDDATITSETTAAIDVVDAESVVVVLADGSDNALADATTYADTSEDAPTGALYSTADLTIGGTGSLTVTGNSNNGIVGKDGLVITGGTIDVTSVDDGIIGKDYLVLTDGTVTVDAVGDAFKSDNTEDAGSGFVLDRGRRAHRHHRRTTASRASRCSCPAARSTSPGPTRPWRAR